jgi:flagellar hook assembly protein FlgD
MAIDVSNKNINTQTATGAKSKLHSEAMIKLNKAERKTPDQYIKNDPEASRKQMEKNKDFLIKMVLANAKNIDPFSEEGSKSNEMAQTMTTIAEIDAMMAQSAKMDEIVHAVKNPGFSATELQGKEVEYDDSKRYFESSKGNVDFSYNIDFADEYKDKGTVKTTIEIVDSEGVVVYKGKGADKKGEHHFVWDGKDNDGKAAKQGFYNIRVKSEGSYTKDGKQLTFAVRSSAALSGKVASVEIENGIATGVLLEGGKFIEKSQIKLIKDTKVSERDVKLDPAFMDNNVNFDLSKIQIKKGACEVYYNNHVKNSGAMEIKIHDASGKPVKTVDYKIEKGVRPGINSITLRDQIKDLADGNYTVSITVEDLDQDSKKITLDNNFVERVAGLNYRDSKVIIAGEREISSHNVKGMTSKNYMSLVDQANAMIGKKVTYRDDTMKFQEGTPVIPTLGFTKTNENNEDAILFEGVMYVYDADNNTVQIVKGQYNPYEQLTDEAKAYVVNENPGNVFDVFNLNNYDILNPDQKLSIHRYIEAEIAKDPANPNIVFADKFKEAQKAKIGKINLSWDGKFGDMRPDKAVLAAKSGEIYRMAFAPTYIRPNGEQFTGSSHFNKGSSVVQEAKVDSEVITLVLENGTEVTEDLVLKVE